MTAKQWCRKLQGTQVEKKGHFTASPLYHLLTPHQKKKQKHFISERPKAFLQQIWNKKLVGMTSLTREKTKQILAKRVTPEHQTKVAPNKQKLSETHQKPNKKSCTFQKVTKARSRAKSSNFCLIEVGSNLVQHQRCCWNPKFFRS